MARADSNLLEAYSRYRGKIEALVKVPVKNLQDFSLWYTPGAATPSMAIFNDKPKAYEYTGKGNSVAIISNGTRVLGLGKIGPDAGLPVMEGKALIFKILGDVDAFPLCIKAEDVPSFVAVARALEPSFGGVNLEDIESPSCFEINEKLIESMEIPVFHDDQHGTSVVVLAGILNALKVVGKKLSRSKIVVMGGGAAGYAVSKLLIKAGADSRKLLVGDSCGVIHPGRKDLNRWKRELSTITNTSSFSGSIQAALDGADALIAVSKPGPGIVSPEMVETMACDPIVFACANPIPEIMPNDAKKAGARIVATGRSDFSNQVNNSLCFPAVFRGMLDVGARKVNDEMKIAAAKSIATVAEERGIDEEHVLPPMDDCELYPREAAAIGEAAIRTNVARLKVRPDEIYEVTKARLQRYQKILHFIDRHGLYPVIYPSVQKNGRNK